jgi:hypothetical protein
MTQTLLTRKDLCTRWGDTLSTIVRYEKDGVITRLPDFPTPKYSLTEIEELEAGGRDSLLNKLRKENQELRHTVGVLEAKLETARRLLT